MLVLIGCSTNKQPEHVRSIASTERIQGCIRDDGLKVFIDTCLKGISAEKKERTWDLFSLVRNSVLYTLTNPGAMSFFSEVALDSRSIHQIDKYFEDEHQWKIGDLGSLRHTQSSSWKDVRWGCEGLESSNGKVLKNSEMTSDLYYSYFKNADTASMDARQFAYLDIDEDIWGLSQEEIVKASLKRMSKRRRRKNNMFKFFDKMSKKGKVFKIVSTKGYFTMYLWQRPVFTPAFDDKGRPRHKWEIVGIDNSDCSA